MNTKALLESLLASAKELASQGRELAEVQLGIPTDGDSRDAMVAGLGKGALAGGLLALMLGTRGGRKLTGSAVKLGSLAAIGTIGYKAYQNWQASSGDAVDAGTPIGALEGPAADHRSIALIRAMMAAAKADGQVDASEFASMRTQLQQMGIDADLSTVLETELRRPLDAKEIGALADSPAAAVEMYLASKVVIDVPNESERVYLRQLAEALRLPGELVTEVEGELEKA